MSAASIHGWIERRSLCTAMTSAAKQDPTSKIPRQGSRSAATAMAGSGAAGIASTARGGGAAPRSGVPQPPQNPGGLRTPISA